jgi:hypothetical protein
MSASTLTSFMPEPSKHEEQHSSSAPSKGSQRCISIHADVDDATSILPGPGQAYASADHDSQSNSVAASKGCCGVVYDAVMELHMREGEGSSWLHLAALIKPQCAYQPVVGSLRCSLRYACGISNKLLQRLHRHQKTSCTVEAHMHVCPDALLDRSRLMCPRLLQARTRHIAP